MEKIKLNYLYEGAVAQITLDDSKGNVLDHIMMEDLQHVLSSFRSKSDIKLIIFEGAGKHFSFGASVEEHQKDLAAAMLHSFHQLFFTLKELAIPTLAKI